MKLSEVIQVIINGGFQASKTVEIAEGQQFERTGFIKNEAYDLKIIVGIRPDHSVEDITGKVYQGGAAIETKTPSTLDELSIDVKNWKKKYSINPQLLRK
jgi:hypothetical protein